MLKDITSPELRLNNIDYTLNEIELPEEIGKRIEQILKSANAWARVDRYTTTIQVNISNQYIYFSNYWYYIAVKCRKFAECVYEYEEFYEKNIRGQEVEADVLNQNFESPSFTSLFENEEEKSLMIKYIIGDSKYGKSIISESKSKKYSRSYGDLFASWVTKSISLVNASAGYFGTLVLLLLKNPGTFDDLEQSLSTENALCKNEYDKAAKMLLEYKDEEGITFSIDSATIKACRDEFMSKFSPEILSSLSGLDLLEKIFYTAGDNSDSLCYYLEHNPLCRECFGGIAGGSSFNYGLFQKSATGIWTAGSSRSPVELSEPEAIERGTKIRDSLLKGVEIIKAASLKTLSDYDTLDATLKAELEDGYNWSWFHKYYSILFDKNFSCFHSDDWQNHVLYALNICPSDNKYTRSGQIAMVQNYASLPYAQFYSLIDSRFGAPKTFVRIGTTDSDGSVSYASEWQQRSVIGIGWSDIGSLDDYVAGDKLDRKALKEKLIETYYNSEATVASRKAGELQQFYKTDSNSIIVAMAGQKLLALVDHIGDYFYDSSSSMAHQKYGQWHMVFDQGEQLPTNEGKLTSCFLLKDKQNLLFLYKRYYYETDTIKTTLNEYESKTPDERESVFKEWMKTQEKEGGGTYSETVINSYARSLREASSKIDGYSYSFTNLFNYSDPEEIEEIDIFIRSASNFEEINKSYANGCLSAGLLKYKEFLGKLRETDMAVEEYSYKPINPNTNVDSLFTNEDIKKIAKNRNRIIFGAPGTGKSFQLREDCEKLLKGNSGSFERVTFHPDYTYSQFVGSYKPVMGEDGKAIKYDFVPGPFMRVYVEALRSAGSDNPQPHLLIIEEINRAKVAAVFGDVFQLLDRDDHGVSEYKIQTTEDIKKYLATSLKGKPSDFTTIEIPNNMFIWATMNSADQGVFQMDTAFKRRWSFEYLGIDQNEDKIVGIGKTTIGDDAEEIEWNKLRRAINRKMSSSDFNINEDKLLGPFFLSKKILESDASTGEILDKEAFLEAFKSKVLMYLYEDAVKQGKHRFFDGCDSSKYSSVCDAFDKIGTKIFGTSFRETYYDSEE